MKTFVRRATLLLAAVAMCQAGIARAEEFQWVSGGQSATLVGDQKVTTEQTLCSSCNQAACNGDCCGTCGPNLGCENCPPFGIVGTAGFDYFKGPGDGAFASNFGAVVGANSAVGLGDTGLGWQLGMSYGVYDLDGRSTVNTATSQQQVFVTTGFFHKAPCDRHLSFGMVYDWMFNDEWGGTGVAPTLGQWRGQIEYAISGSNAFGIYGCLGDRGYNRLINEVAVYKVRAVSQVDLFWHHKFCSGADSYLWFGLPERERIGNDGSLYDWLFGVSLQVPITERLALYGNAQYMHPSGAASAAASTDSGYNVGMGIAWYFGGNANSSAINGKCNLPYMPVANNSTFMADANATIP